MFRPAQAGRQGKQLSIEYQPHCSSPAGFQPGAGCLDFLCTYSVSFAGPCVGMHGHLPAGLFGAESISGHHAVFRFWGAGRSSHGAGQRQGFRSSGAGEGNGFFFAQGAETSRVAVSLKVYNLKTRATVWYLDCMARGAGREETDWIFWKRAGHEPPLPDALLAGLAGDIARLMATRGRDGKKLPIE